MAGQGFTGPGGTTGTRLAWVDAAKGISILLVVAHHTVMFMQSSGLAPPAVVAANTALASLRMPLFFLVSGLFIAGPLAASWPTLLHKRVAFFGYLFLLWTVLRFAFFQIGAVDAIDPYHSADAATLVLAPLLPGSLTWFLYALALYSVIAKLALRVPAWLALGVTGTLSALLASEVLVLESAAWTRILRYLFFFLLGWHARAYAQRLAEASTFPRMAAAAAGCVVLAGSAVVFDLQGVPGVGLALNLAAVAAGVLLAAWICRYRVGRPLVELGRRTLPVYLIHVFWVAVAMVGLHQLAVPAALTYPLPVLLALGMTMLSLATHRLFVRIGGTWLFALPERFAYHQGPTGRHARHSVAPDPESWLADTQPISAVTRGDPQPRNG